jgi:predicted ATPase/DNA-binding SARP family transcriptional activator
MGNSSLRVYLFGHFRMESQTGPIQLPTRKVEALLAYLILNPNPHSRELLAALLWGDTTDARARASLRNALSILRRKISNDLLLADRATVQLNPYFPLWVDALDFKTQATGFLEAPSSEHNCVKLELYSDDLLAEFYEDWVLVERQELQALYLKTLLEFTQQCRSASEYERAIQYAHQVLAVDAANERAHQHLMFCYVAQGKRSAALRQYEACRRALQDELAVEPSPETKSLKDWIEQASAERAPIEASITNLPIYLTSFIGRQQEMVQVKQLLSTERLLTLTGAGGSGKTRLAVQAATDLVDTFHDGVWWVELAALAEGALVPRSVAKALGVSEVPSQPVSETMVNFLRPRHLLLVLDNCEHLSTACANLIERLLSTCPDIKIMATSREALRINGERVWSVPTLSLPDRAPTPDPELLLQYEAVQLFVERAESVRRDFALSDQNARFVEKICRQLDGMPLALELAAARVKALTVQQILTRLDDAFRLLTRGSRTALPRHQTLRAAIDWSYELLSEEEQSLFRRLSVFAGGWTLEAAEIVSAGEGIEEREVLDLLSRLVDKSLVEMHAHGEAARYRMLQTVQHYSHEKLLQSGEAQTTRKRHFDYFCRLVEAANPHLGFFLSDMDMLDWQRRLEPENDNLRAALQWSLEKEDSVEDGLRMASLLHWFWFVRSYFSEGRAWLARLLDKSASAPADVRAQALLTAGYLACWQGDFASGHAPLAEANRLYRQMEDGRGIAFSLHGLGMAAMGEGNPGQGRSFFAESLQVARQVGDKPLTSFALHFLAIMESYRGEYSLASSHFEECLVLTQEIGGNQQAVAFSLFHLARIARLQGDYSQAQAQLAESLHRFRQIGDRRGIGYALAGFAVLAALQGKLHRAARLAGTILALQAELGSLLEAPLQLEYDRELAAVEAELGEELFATSQTEGQAMAMNQAIEYALGLYLT